MSYPEKVQVVSTGANAEIDGVYTYYATKTLVLGEAENVFVNAGETFFLSFIDILAGSWVLAENAAEVGKKWINTAPHGGEFDPTGEYIANEESGATGTATVSEYTETLTGDSNMAHEVFIRPNGDYCYRTINIEQEAVWDPTASDGAGALDDAAADVTTGAVAAVFNPSLGGYPYTVPTGLPSGTYRVILYAAAYDAITDATEHDTGFEFKWSAPQGQRPGQFYKPVEKVSIY